MALEDVLNEILAQSRRESKKIVNDGKEVAEAIIQDAKKITKEKRENFKKETERLIEETKNMQISTENLKIDKLAMQAKNEFLNELFLKFVEHMNKLNLKEREKIIEKLVNKAVKEIDDPAFIYANNKDKQFLLHLKKIKFNGTIDTIGGIIIENRKRDIRVNYTFETFLEKLKEMYLFEIANRFFKST